MDIKKILLAALGVFLAWGVTDFIIHGVLLADAYKATAHLWRTEAEMQMGLMYGVSAIVAVVASGTYSMLVGDKSLHTGIKYGLSLGLIVGIGMGFGTYTYMPIPMSLALSWFAGSLVQWVLAGAIIGALIKD